MTQWLSGLQVTDVFVGFFESFFLVVLLAALFVGGREGIRLLTSHRRDR